MIIIHLIMIMIMTMVNFNLIMTMMIRGCKLRSTPGCHLQGLS